MAATIGQDMDLTGMMMMTLFVMGMAITTAAEASMSNVRLNTPRRRKVESMSDSAGDL
jgi:hypothetical protein